MKIKSFTKVNAMFLACQSKCFHKNKNTEKSSFLKIAYRIKAFLPFLIYSKTKHAAHSPFLYDFILSVFENSQKNLHLEKCFYEKKLLFQNHSEIEICDFGTGRINAHNYVTKVSLQAKRSLKSNREIRQIFNLVAKYKPKQIIELGTSFGITSMAMAFASEESSILSFEGCPNTAEYAKRNFQKYNLNQISVVLGNIDEVLSSSLSGLNAFDMAVVDANHTYQNTLDYFFMLKSLRNSKSIIIFDDIHWSKEINNAWQKIKADEDITLTVETWNYGFVFFNSDLSKQDFIIRK